MRTKSRSSGLPGTLFRCCVLTSILLSAFGVYSGQANPPPKKSVLVIHSYHHGMRWADSVSLGIQSVMDTSTNISIQVSTEFMDTKRLATDDYFEELRRLYKTKYAASRFDALIACDDDAFNFLRRFRDDLFGPIPVVFCGVNYFRAELLADFPRCTGVVESFDLRKTLDIALKFHPATRQIVFINDQSTTGKANRKRLEEIIPEYTDRVSFVFYEDMTMDEVVQNVRTLPPDNLVLLMTFNRDKAGQVFQYWDVSQQICPAAPVPVYGIWDFYLGDGIVGGMLISGEEHGRMAAEMIASVLRGEDIHSIPVVQESPNRYMFDYAQLQRFDIPVSSIPPGSRLINQPAATYRISKKVLWGISVTLGLLLFGGTMLVIDLFERRRAQKALRHANEQLLQEIGERRHVEETLRDSELNYRMVFDAANDAIFVFDLESRRIVDANERSLRMFGVASAGEMSIHDFWVGPPFTSRAFAKRILHAVSGRPQVFEWLTQNKQGKTFWMEISLKHAVIGGKEKIVAVTRDISERKTQEEARRKIDEQLQRTQRLESLGMLAGGIAHDFNNLLMGILGNANLAQMESPEGSPVRDYVHHIETSAMRAAELTRQMLAYAGKGSLFIRLFDLNKLVTEMANLLEVSISKNVLLRYDLAQNLPPVEGDPSQFRQIVLNLIVNASDAIGDKSGAIMVRTGLTQQDLKTISSIYISDGMVEGSYEYVEVSDTGCGMNSETRARMFEPFFSTKFTGRGLGLAAVLGIIKAHHGGIHVDSDPRRGTTIRVYVPSAHKAELEADAGAAQNSPARRPAIPAGAVLIVDDEESVRLVSKRMLEKYGCTVLTARDGREGVELFKRRSNDIVLVLLDLTMPHMDGRQAFKALKEIKPDIRVILCSGYGKEDARLRFQDEGLSGYLQKPFNFESLTGEIERVWNQT